MEIGWRFKSRKEPEFYPVNVDEKSVNDFRGLMTLWFRKKKEKKKSLCFVAERRLEGNDILGREHKEVASVIHGEMTVALDVMDNYRAITLQLH